MIKEMKILALILALSLSACMPFYQEKTTEQPNTVLLNIKKLLDSNSPVSIAVVVESVNNPDAIRKYPEKAYSSWAKSIENEMVSTVSQELLFHFSNSNSFSLLDRNKLNQILSEYSFQHQGYTRQIDAQSIGQFLNASHLIILSFSRYQNGKLTNDIVHSTLISVKDAKILAVSQISKTF